MCFLVYRTAAFIDGHESCPDEDSVVEAQSICSDALTLREALDSWHVAYAQGNSKIQTPWLDSEDASMLLSRIFFAAISIYLSGIFDYEMIHWHRMGLLPPTLDQQTIQTHTNTILRLSDIALDQTDLSPLLFLFPLRIAGARSRTQWQRDCVMKLIGRIGGGFAVASAISAELSHVWQMYGLEENTDME
jgi:hypothetical protein